MIICFISLFSGQATLYEHWQSDEGVLILNKNLMSHYKLYAEEMLIYMIVLV